MNDRKKSLTGTVGKVAVLLVSALLSNNIPPLNAQSASAGERKPGSTAIDAAQSHAADAANQLVSLSSDRIIAILRQEPGLLLEIKKALVRKAYEQGRVLDPRDVTDDSVFRQLRDDPDLRVLATQEMEARSYIRAKPTEAEMQHIRVAETSPSGRSTDKEKRPAGSGQLVAGDQEAVYWSRHDLQVPQNPSRNESLDAPQYENREPSNAPPQRLPEETYPVDSPSDVRRQLRQTELQEENRPENFDQSQPGYTEPPSRPATEEVPGLLNTKASNVSSGSFGREETASYYSDAGISSRNGRPGGGAGLEPEFSNPKNPYSSASRDRNYGLTSRDFRLPQASAQPALRHRPNPYADIPSLYDLYEQYAKRSPVLQRFGEDIFRNGTGNLEQLPMDLPVGPDYVVGPGDGLSIDLWGGVAQHLQRVVDRQGRVALPEVGSVPVSGRNLGDVQRVVQSALRSQFRDAQADVSLARIRTIRIYVVGDVERPGGYDVSSLSTPLNALYAAGGPTARGSLRTLRHYRGTKLVQETDVYDLLLHGVRADVERLESGDTVLVPPLGAEITVEGMVRRPASYELGKEKTLSQALELAGGVLSSGTLRHLDVERLTAHESRTMLRLDIPESNNQEATTKALDDFAVQDGDKIKISPILPYADKTVYLDGHVSRPGKFAYRDGMKVTDLIKSYADLLPEPSLQHAEVIRLVAPAYTPVVLAFNLADAMSGKDSDLSLEPFDVVRVFGRFDFEEPPVVTVSGEVRDPGDHLTNGSARLRDVVFLAGGVTPDARLDDAQIFRKSPAGKLSVIDVELDKALAGSDRENVVIEPGDRVFVHRNLNKVDPPTVTVAGEVAKPGKYPLGDMSAADLVRLAGGLKRGAYTETADLTRYLVEEGQKIVGEHTTVSIGAALAGQPDTDVRLRDGDVLTIGALAGWNDVGATITVKGEVQHPGAYGIQEGERLSSILERAGGLRTDAYPYGTIFQREQVRDIEEKTHSDLIRQIQDEGIQLRQVPEGDQDQKQVKEASLAQWQTTLDRLSNTPPAGRLVIHISKNVKRWENTSADITVRGGDVIYIPKRPNTIVVDGSVYNPTAISFKPGKNTGWYLRQSGGPTNLGNKKAVFVIRADGSVVGGSGGMFSGGVEKTALAPGDMVVVPEKAFSANSRWKTTLEGAQLAYAIGIAIQVARSF